MTKPKKTKEKAVLMTIGNVRIVEYDSTNVMVERLEESKKSTNEVTSKWRFKGYSRTIHKALRMIVTKELLIDKNEVRDLKTFLEQVENSNALIWEAIET